MHHLFALSCYACMVSSHKATAEFQNTMLLSSRGVFGWMCIPGGEHVVAVQHAQQSHGRWLYGQVYATYKPCAEQCVISCVQYVTITCISQLLLILCFKYTVDVLVCCTLAKWLRVSRWNLSCNWTEGGCKTTWPLQHYMNGSDQISKLVMLWCWSDQTCVGIVIASSTATSCQSLHLHQKLLQKLHQQVRSDQSERILLKLCQ